MGGRKRPTISQLEKRARKAERAALREKVKEKKAKQMTKFSSALGPVELTPEQVLKEIRNMPCVTPYMLASKFDIKISKAKAILRELEAHGLIKAVDKSRRVSIYVIAS